MVERQNCCKKERVLLLNCTVNIHRKAAEKYCLECGGKFKEKVESQLMECSRCLAKQAE